MPKVESSHEQSEEEVSQYEHRFIELILKYDPKVRRALIRRFGLNNIDDILQEANLRVWKYRGSYDPQKSRFFSWYFKIALRVAINHYHKTKNQHTLEEPDSLDTDSALLIRPATPSDSTKNRARLHYDEMQRRCRNDHERKLLHAYVLHEFWGYSWVELRRYLNVPETPQGFSKASKRVFFRILRELKGSKD